MDFPTNETVYDDSGGVDGNESLGFCDEEANPNFRLFMIRLTFIYQRFSIYSRLSL